MAIQSTGDVLHAQLERTSVDHDLQSILNEVNRYLLNYSNSWISIVIGRLYFQKCIRSWVRVTTHLEKFLQDPRAHYSLLMIVLEIEINKFPKRSYYGKHLQQLAILLSKGPRFTITSQF